MRGPSETVHNGNLIVWACCVIAPLIIIYKLGVTIVGV